MQLHLLSYFYLKALYLIVFSSSGINYVLSFSLS